MKRILILAFALVAAVSSWAVAREYTLTLNVTAPEGALSAGQEFNLLCVPYSVYYPASETKLDAEGHASLKLYPGQHKLSLDVKGMRSVEQSFDVTADLTIDIALEEAVETPYSLSSRLMHDIFTGRNDLTLSWNGDEVLFYDDFESYEPFILQWGEWTGIDVDGHFADAMVGDYPNRGLCNYGQVMNPLKVNPIWDIKYYWTLAARSGNQYIGFMQNADGTPNNDWVITPAMTLTADNQLRFYVKSADAVDAKFTVGITEAENPKPSDFTLIQPGNYITAPYADWTEVIIPLSAYAGRTVRIGINCLSSYGTAMSMLDDLFVGRLNPENKARSKRVARRSAANPYEAFVISLDGVEVGRTDSYTYTFENLPEGTHTLGVKAVYTQAESEEATMHIVIDPETYRTVTFETTTDNGAIPPQMKLTLTPAEDEEDDYIITLTDGKATVKSLPVGKYTLTVEQPGYDAIEETITVDAENTAFTIALKETRVTPFNIVHTATEADNGTFDVALTWNTDLGFYDGFEEYDDFATQWGEWVTYDFNADASYPIALGSLSNEVSFPGASTTAARVPVPPMVFNPDKTTPKLSVDAAFAAVFGEKYVMFQGPANARADKWIITPEISIYDDYELSFIAKAYTIYPESIEVCVSAGSTDTADFIVLDTIDLPYEQWTQYVIDLSEYKGYTLRFAIHCTSMDGFVCQVDEFKVGRSGGVESVLDGHVLSFDVTLDGKAAVNTAENSIRFSGVEAGDHSVGITANYASGASEIATYSFTIESSGIESLTAPGANTTVDVFTLQGIRIISGATATDINALPAGIYLTPKGKILKR